MHFLDPASDKCVSLENTNSQTSHCFGFGELEMLGIQLHLLSTNTLYVLFLLW